MHINPKTPAVECLENGKLPRTGIFSSKTTFFKIDPSARKLQESGNTQNQIKEK